MSAIVHTYMPAHPAADLFPMLDDADLRRLVDDIRENGQAVPIVVWNGRVVDGRNRLRACGLAGVAPKIREAKFKDDSEAVRFIVSTNIHRRHLTDDQRRVIAARLVTMGQGGDRANPQSAGLVSVAAAAAMTSTSEAGVERARTVLRADPALADEVAAGKKTLNKALKEVKASKEREMPDPNLRPALTAETVLSATPDDADHHQDLEQAVDAADDRARAVAAFDELHAAAGDLERVLQRWWKAQRAVEQAGAFDNSASLGRACGKRVLPRMFAAAGQLLRQEYDLDPDSYFSDGESPDLRIADSVAAWREAWLAGRVGVDGFEIEATPAKRGGR